MRKLLLILALLISAASMSARSFVWLDTVHDFGAFSEDMGLVRCTFRAVNTSDAPVAVVSARANCGCTHPEYPKNAIAPGDTLKVSVAYDAKGRPGRFEKKVYVSTGDGEQMTLRVKGTVIGAPTSLAGRYPVEGGAARYSTTVMPFGEVLKGRVAHAMIRGYNTTDHVITPTVTDLPEYIDISVRPAQVPPGEQFAVSATSTTDRCDSWGFVTDSFTIASDAGAPEKVGVSTVMIVKEDFSKLTPGQRAKAPHASADIKAVDFGVFDRASDHIKKEFFIENTGLSPLVIRQVSTPDKSLTVKCPDTKIKKGKKAKVEVTLNPGAIAENELLNARITLITNDPDHPVQMIRVVGEPR